MVSLLAAPRAEGEVRYVDAAPARARDRRLPTARSPAQGRAFAESFWTVALARHRRLRDAERALRLARGLRRRASPTRCAPSTRRIVARGLRAPDRRARPRDGAPHAVRRPPARRVPALRRAHASPRSNRALAGVPRDRVRLHVCWGNYEGPHTFDVALEELLPRVLTAHVSARSCSRWRTRATRTSTACSRATALPADWLLVAGVIDTTTNYVEHPEVVAERLERAARADRRPAPRARRHRLRLRHRRRPRRGRRGRGLGEAARPPRGGGPGDAPAAVTRTSPSTSPSSATPRSMPSGGTVTNDSRSVFARGGPA